MIQNFFLFFAMLADGIALKNAGNREDTQKNQITRARPLPQPFLLSGRYLQIALSEFRKNVLGIYLLGYPGINTQVNYPYFYVSLCTCNKFHDWDSQIWDKGSG